VDHSYLTSDELIPGVSIQGAPYVVAFMDEYDTITF
jgi:hypothetical protein